MLLSLCRRPRVCASQLIAPREPACAARTTHQPADVVQAPWASHSTEANILERIRDYVVIVIAAAQLACDLGTHGVALRPEELNRPIAQSLRLTWPGKHLPSRHYTYTGEALLQARDEVHVLISAHLHHSSDEWSMEASSETAQWNWCLLNPRAPSAFQDPLPML